MILLAQSFLITISFQSSKNVTLVWQKDAATSVGVKTLIETKKGNLITARTMSVKDGIGVVCFKSSDKGKNWQQESTIVSDENKKTDIGDGAFCQLSSGELLYVCRHNHFKNLPTESKDFSIRVLSSFDEGTSWKDHSVVKTCKKTNSGLWSSFLFLTKSNKLQCYFDDEYEPETKGFNGHQWLQMKTWNNIKKAWENEVTVSRANNPSHLSRDGMASVVELNKGELLCAIESVQVNYPHRGLIRYVKSYNDGQSWSWKDKERFVLYQAKDKDFNALAPWLIKLSNNALVCVFVTDEDRKIPDTVSTGKLDQNTKFCISTNDGKNWSFNAGLIDNAHPTYHPGIVQISNTKNDDLIAIYTHNGVPKQRFGKLSSTDKFFNSEEINVRPVDLLDRTNPLRDSISGKWRKSQDGLTSDDSENAQFKIPYHPPEEYNLKVHFTPERGDSTIFFVANGKQLAFVLGGWNNTKTGFETINGKRAIDNLSSSPQVPINKVKNICLIEVRKDRLSAYLNGMLVSELAPVPVDAYLTKGWSIRDSKAIGLHSWKSRNTFHKVEIQEIHGSGKSTLP